MPGTYCSICLWKYAPVSILSDAFAARSISEADAARMESLKEPVMSAAVVTLHFNSPDAYAAARGIGISWSDMLEIIRVAQSLKGVDVTTPEGLSLVIIALQKLAGFAGLEQWAEKVVEVLNDNNAFQVLLALVRWLMQQSFLGPPQVYSYGSEITVAAPDFERWIGLANLIIQFIQQIRQFVNG